MNTPLVDRPVVDPELSDGDNGDHDRFTHYVQKSDHPKGYVLGQPIKAICGKLWVPTRDPDMFPMCPTCKQMMARLRGGK